MKIITSFYSVVIQESDTGGKTNGELNSLADTISQDSLINTGVFQVRSQGLFLVLV